MGVYNTANIKIGPGVLYAAPLGSAEPVSVTGAWPSAWQPLGFTDQGSQFQFGPQIAAVMVEELFWPVEQAIVSYEGKMSFVLAETTRQNLAFALNCGISGQTNQGANVDGSLWQEPPNPGQDQRVMLGWDSINESGGTVQTSSTDPYGRIIIRQALQTGQVTTVHRKGNNKTMYSCEFALEFPRSGLQPFRFIIEPNLAA